MDGDTVKQRNRNRKTEKKWYRETEGGSVWLPLFMCGPVSCMDMYGHGNLSSHKTYGYVKSTAGNKGKVGYKGEKGRHKVIVKNWECQAKWDNRKNWKYKKYQKLRENREYIEIIMTWVNF